jgi:hypothetical protein
MNTIIKLFKWLSDWGDRESKLDWGNLYRSPIEQIQDKSNHLRRNRNDEIDEDAKLW